jgi:ABC-type taurine transport system substrate-binding protein
MKKRSTARWPNIDTLVKGSGDVTIGRVGPIPCAAVASDEHQMLAALVRRPKESLEELIARLDAAIGDAWENDVFTDEING